MKRQLLCSVRDIAARVIVWLTLGIAVFGSISAWAAPLDSAPNVAAAYSLRQLRGTYSGPAITVRRSSDDAELAIGFDGSGNLNTSALLAFVGAGSGYVSRWFDQSGFGRDLVQPTTSLQPLVVQSGSVVTRSGRPAIYAMLGTQMSVNPANWLVSGNGDRALNAVMTRNSETVFAVWSGDHDNNRAFGIDLSGYLLYAPYTYGEGDTVSDAIPTGVTNIVTAIRDGGTSSGFLNGALRGSNSQAITTDPTFGLGIGTRPDGAEVDGWYSEIIYFSAAISTSGRQSLEHDQGSWFGLTVNTASPVISASYTLSSTVLVNTAETANFKAIPGATLAYVLTITNFRDSPDSNGIVIDNNLPPDLDLYVGDLANGAPFVFTDGSPSCGLTISFTSLSSTTDDVDFLDAAGALITPSGDAEGFTTSVRKLRFKTKGQLGANFGVPPNCTITYHARIQ